MDIVNSQQTQRVWQRVHGQTQAATTDDLSPLIDAEWDTSATCLALARRSGGKFAPILRQLADRSRSRWGCLQGLAMLHTGKRPRHTHPHSPTGDPGELLRRCYSEGIQRIRQYENLAGQHGPILTQLAQEQTRDCRTILELLGNWGD